METTKDIMITTMPIKPYDKIGVGLLIGPTVADVFGNMLKCKKCLSFNLLHSYEDNYLKYNNYMTKIHEFGIDYDQIVIDEDVVEDSIDRIRSLHKRNLVRIKTKDMYICKCGRVEILKTVAASIKKRDLFQIEQDKIICNYCGEECIEYKKECLVLKIDNYYTRNISIYPQYLKKEMQNLENIYLNTEIVISKTRKTGYCIELEKHLFYIDIDMLWMFFNFAGSSKKQILVASNHQLYEMFLSNYINNVFAEKEVHYIATPYLHNKENINLEKKILNCRNSKTKKLLILYNLKWKYKTTNWNNGIISILYKLKEEDACKLYDYICNPCFDRQDSLNEKLNKILEIININKNIASMKEG